MSSDAKLYSDHGVEFVESDGETFGLGLQVPEKKELHLPTLASATPLLSFDECKRIVESEDFSFGQKFFDQSWTTNQNGFGSCAAYAGKSGVAKARHIQGQERVELSGDYLYSRVNGGRDRGSLLKDVMEAIMLHGIATAATVPLGGIYRSKYDTTFADSEAKRFRGHELFIVPDEQSMVTALTLRIPVVMAIHVGNGWKLFDSDNFLAPAPGVGNHSEHCDDIYYDRKRGCFAMRKGTSHSVNYNPAHGGYCQTTWRDHYATTIRHHVFYAVGAAVQDPSQDNPPLPHGVQPEPTPEPSAVSLVMETRVGCGWCDRWKSEQLPRIKSLGWNYKEANGIGPVPTFHLQRGAKKKTVVGFKTAEELNLLVP